MGDKQNTDPHRAMEMSNGNLNRKKGRSILISTELIVHIRSTPGCDAEGESRLRTAGT
jgi:hypothetical protein